MNDDSSLTIDDLLRESAWVSRLARSLVRDAQTADDLVQETWLSALRRPPARRTSPRGWLATVLRNALRQQRRKEAARVRHEVAGASPPEPPSASALAERVELSRRVARLALELDEPFRSTVLRRHFEGKSSAEIARADGVPEGTVRWRLKEGLDRLRGRLDRDYGGDRRAWCAALLPLARQDVAAGVGAAALTAGGLLVKMAYVAAATVVVVGAAIWIVPFGDGGSGPRAPERAVAAGAPAIEPEGGGEEAGRPASPERVAETPAKSADVAPTTAPVAAAAESDRAAVTARVVDPDGRPLEGAVVELTDVPGYRTTTREDGTARLEGTVPEEMLSWLGDAASFRVARAGYTTRIVEARLVLGEEVPLGDVVLRPGATVVGRVEDGEGQPVAGATVWAERIVGGATVRVDGIGSDAEATTDRAGRFELGGAPAGTLRIGARHDRFDAGHSEAFDVGPGDLEEGVVLRLAPTELYGRARIEGVVVDPDGRPVAGAMVHHEASAGGITSRGSTLTEEDGSFDLEPFAPAAYRLRATAPDGSFAPSETLSVDPGASPTLRLRPPRTFTVVARGAGGAPLDAFEVSARPVDARTWAFSEARDGVATLQLPSEPFELEVAAPLHDEVALGPLAPAAVGEGGRVEVDLPPLPALAGTVTRDGEPVPGARVRVHAVAEDWAMADGFQVWVHPTRAAQGETGDDGAFALTLREEGRFVVRVTAFGAAPAEVGPFEYDPAAGMAPMDVRLGDGGAIEGRVLPPPGRSPAGTIVAVSRGDAYARTVRVGRDGVFRFERLVPGRYHVVKHDRELDGESIESFATGGLGGGAPPWSCEVAEERTTRCDLDLSVCVLRGRLRADDPSAHRASLVDPATGRAVGAPAAPRADGTFTLVAPAAGAYVLRIADGGGETRVEDTIEVAWGETRWRGG